MRGIILWYNANRKSIWKIIGVIVVVIIVVQLFRYLWRQDRELQKENMVPVNDVSETNLNSIALDGDKSPVSGERIPSSQTKLLEVLDKFVDYCNDGKINEAYELLSEDCKQEMYPTIQNFKASYYNKIFSGKRKNISVENWVGSIYKVKYMEDALSTGIYNTDNVIQDYITIVKKENETAKININNYIGKQKMDIEKEDLDIKIKVIEKDKYMDYETYVYEITNQSGNVILINDANNTDAMYLEDTNGIKYSAYTHEISDAELKIAIGETKKVKIKYYNKYSSSKNIKTIVFSKIILNYNAYINYQNPGYYRNYGTIQISL